MTSPLFKNTVETLKSAIDRYLITEINNENLDEIKKLCELLKDFPETLFQFLNKFVLNNDEISSVNRLIILEYIDHSLYINLNEETLIKKLKLYEDNKQFDKIIIDIEKYELDKDILSKKFKAEILILILRVYTKNHLFETILNLTSRTEQNIGIFNFDDDQQNRYYNYLARAFAFMQRDGTMAMAYLNKALKIESSVEIEIRNFRYSTLCYWKIGDKSCIDKAQEGIDFINLLEDKKKYKKYYSDLHRLKSASLINEGKLDDALKASKSAHKIISKEKYYDYEKFWIDFQQCCILRKLEKFTEASKKIYKIESNENYQQTLNKSTQAKYKIETEKLKISICKRDNLIAVITKLNSRSYQTLIKTLLGRFYRYLMLAEAYHHNNSKQKAQDYFSTAKIFSVENNIEYENIEKYIQTNNLIENGKRP